MKSGNKESTHTGSVRAEIKCEMQSWKSPEK